MRAAYGVSVTAREGVVCIGGSDARRHLTNVYVLKWNGRQLAFKDLPPLPLPVAYGCGALLGRHIYVAGGTETPEAVAALHTCFRLDLGDLKAGWQTLPPWPGRPRMLATAAAVGGSFFVVGGADLHADAQGKPARTYLSDAYRYSPQRGWKRIAALPNPDVAAASPAPSLHPSSFLLVGGDDGSLVDFEPPSKHPGFPRRVFRYDTKRDEWSLIGNAPGPRATLPTAFWRGLYVLPGGEVRPGVRSPEVWALRTPSARNR